MQGQNCIVLHVKRGRGYNLAMVGICVLSNQQLGICVQVVIVLNTKVHQSRVLYFSLIHCNTAIGITELKKSSLMKIDDVYSFRGC